MQKVTSKETKNRRTEDVYWLEKARQGEKSGYLGTDETRRFIEEKLCGDDLSTR